MDQSQRIHLLITFLILMKKQELMVDSSPVRNSPPPFNVAEDVYVTQMYNVSVCVIDGTPYDDGEFIPTIDPCESCICHPPGFACKMIRCKKVPTGCIQKAKRLDDCCPRVVCDDAPTHNLVYRIGNENDTIVWSTEEPPTNLTKEQDIPLEAEENIVEELLVAESNITTKNQTTSNAPKQTTPDAESTSKVPSTTIEIATSSEVPLSTLKIATSSEISTSTIQIATTDFSNVSKDSLITKQLAEPTTMVVNYSIQLIVDTATFSPNILQDDVNDGDEVRNPQVPINISLPLPAKGSNDLLRKPIENDLNVPLPATLSVDIEVNKPEANNGTSILAESSTHEDLDTGNSTVTIDDAQTTEEILSAIEEKQLSDNATTKLDTSEEQNITTAAAENYSNSATPSTSSTENLIADANNSTLEKGAEDISQSNGTDIPSETTEDSIKTTHLPPAVARSVDSDENKFGQPEVPLDVTPLPADEIEQISDEPIMKNDFESQSNSSVSPADEIEQISDEPIMKNDFDSQSNSSVSPPKTDQINSQNYNSFIPSGPIIFPNDQNFINEHGMRPRDVETTTIEKKQTENEPNQQTTEIAIEKLADSAKEETSEKNISEINPSENNAEERLTQNINSKNQTNEDQIQQDTTILPTQSSEPSEESMTEEQDTSTEQQRDISTTSQSPEKNSQLSDETNDSYPESSVELENICPHFKRKLISEESSTSSNQKSQPTEKTTSEDPQTAEEITMDSELPLEASSKIPVQSPASTVQIELEAPRGLLDQSEEVPSAVPNATSTEQPKQATESSLVEEQSQKKLATTVGNVPTASEPKAAQEVVVSENPSSVGPAEQDEAENVTISFPSTQPSTVTIPEAKILEIQTNNFSIHDSNPSTRKLESTQNENELNESVTEQSSIKNEDNQTTPIETVTNTVEPAIKIEIIPSEVRSLSDKTTTEKQLEASTEAITTNSQVTTEEVVLKANSESEKPVSESTTTNIATLETEKSLPDVKDEKPLPEPTELTKEIENSANEQAQKSENSPEIQTQTPLSTAGSEAESLVMVTHSQTDQETSKKDSPNTDFQQSTTETMTSSPWTVVMETIFSSVEPSSYDPLNEN